MEQLFTIRAKTSDGYIEHDFSDIEVRSLMKALRNNKNMSLFEEFKKYLMAVLRIKTDTEFMSWLDSKSQS